MRLSTLFACPLAVGLAFLAGSAAQAGIVSLTPADINGGDTNSTSFSDGSITLTPLLHDGAGFVQDTFNGGAARLGMDTAGTNANAFNDPDTTVGNAGDEALEYDLAAGFGLSQVTYDFSRADGTGPNDGVVFSGFTANPVVGFNVVDPRLFAVWDGVDSVRVHVPGQLFGGTLTEINFGNPSASDGQTILMTVNDTDQAGAQLAIRGISYTSIPEPTALALACLVIGAAARRR